MFWFILFLILLFLLVFSIINLSINGSKGYQKSKTKESSEKPTKTEFKNRTTYYEDKSLIVTQFKIAGVTFRDGKYTRQASLRKLKYHDEPMIEPIIFEFNEYEYDNKPAVLIKANGRVLGNVPANYVDEFIDIKHNNEFIKVDYTVSGGGNYSFGCKMWVTWRINNDN